MGDFNQAIDVSETFPPPPELRAKAHVKSMEEYQAMYKASLEARWQLGKMFDFLFGLLKAAASSHCKMAWECT